MIADKNNQVECSGFSSLTSGLKERIAELEKSIKDLDHFFSLEEQACPSCNEHTLQIIENHSAKPKPDETAFEINCTKCGVSDASH